MKDTTTIVNLEDLHLADANRILEHAGRDAHLCHREDPAAQLQALIDGLCDLSMHDGLTGLVNATFFRASLASELDRTSRTGRTCALIIFDLDRFKQVNDVHGHHVGDLVLQAVAQELKNSLRSMDLAARIGGEEFAVMLPECGADDAVRAALRIHRNLCPLTVNTGETALQITTSAGLAWTEPCIATSPKVLMAQADAELYRAKRSGRERLCHADLAPTRLSPSEHAALISPLVKEDSYGQ
jgi:diguanylate cyclase (GGDEF)-like protein